MNDYLERISRKAAIDLISGIDNVPTDNALAFRLERVADDLIQAVETYKRG